MVMLASSLSATENSRRRELFDKALGNVTRHTSHVTRHTSHVTRHTSHVTRHTSHATRHTPHATRHTSPPPLSRHPAATFESTFPSTHSDVAATIVLCAAAAADMGDVTRKRDLCLRALAIYEGKRSLSSSSPPSASLT
jgi:DNA mismatch repair protein MutH